jgi:hypothetical protein
MVTLTDHQQIAKSTVKTYDHTQRKKNTMYDVDLKNINDKDPNNWEMGSVNRWDHYE